jgi:hypothetical protein
VNDSGKKSLVVLNLIGVFSIVIEYVLLSLDF